MERQKKEHRQIIWNVFSDGYTVDLPPKNSDDDWFSSLHLALETGNVRGRITAAR
jgi:hypothetical protein